MKVINVVAAVIIQDNKVFATQRGYGEFIGGWEFPGGKVEPHETKEIALKREIKEELAINIEVDEFLMTVNYQYPNFYLNMDCYLCSMPNHQYELKEHLAASWISKSDLNQFDWLEADLEIIEKLKNILK